MNRDSRHIESVFAVLTKKSDSFKKQKDIRTTPISCIVMCDYAFLGIYLILFKCGALYRLFLLGFCQNLLRDKREKLHTFFLYITHRIGDATVKNLNYYEESLPFISVFVALLLSSCRLVTRSSKIQGRPTS